MKSRLRILAGLLLISSYGFSQATEHWSAEISHLTVFENGSAFMIVSNPRNGPTGSFPCEQGVVYLGVKDTPANNALLSQAMMIYAAGKTTRFGVRRSGVICESEYITAE